MHNKVGIKISIEIMVNQVVIMVSSNWLASEEITVLRDNKATNEGGTEYIKHLGYGLGSFIFPLPT